MNVTFVGMSGAGKSYLGQQFAERFRMRFIDIDREMEVTYGKPLQAILGEIGEARFLEEQSSQVTNLGTFDNVVISPGGSVVYSPAAVTFLTQNSVVVYLDVPVAVIQARVAAATRGIIGLGAKTFAELYAERQELYAQAAHLTIDPSGKDVPDMLESIYRACMLKWKG